MSLYNSSQVLDCLKVQFVGKGKTEKEKKFTCPSREQSGSLTHAVRQ